MTQLFESIADGDRPEKLIVAAAKSLGMSAFADYQPGARPDLPSIVFESTGAREVDTFSRGIIVEQSFHILLRAELYDDIIRLTDEFPAALKRIAGSRYAGAGGGAGDHYHRRLNYRSRGLTIGLRW